jgi:hypothetical protein
LILGTSLASAGDIPTRHLSLLSVTFDLPKRLLVETEGLNGVDEAMAMAPGKCPTQYCPPVVWAWECRFDAEPKCSELNMTPPEDLCHGTSSQAISHSSGLNETRWVCSKVDATDGFLQAGFTIFDLKSGKLVISYLGGEADVPPGPFFDGIEKSIKHK